MLRANVGPAATVNPSSTALAPSAAVSRPAAGAVLAEWGWPIAFAFTLAFLIEIPHRLAATQATDGIFFVGTLWSPHDVAQYVSAMRQGAASSGWLIYDRFSQEPHAAVLMYPLYVAFGKLAALTHTSVDGTYQLLTTLARVFLCLAAYFFTGIVLKTLGARRLALALITLATGLASVIALVRTVTGLPLPMTARELNDPELGTFLTFFAAPHLTIGLGLLLVAARLYAESWESSLGSGCSLALVAAVTGLGLTNPFSLVPLCIVVGAHALLITVQKERIQWSGWQAVTTIAATAVPFLIANYVSFQVDPFWGATYGRQNQTLTPPPIDVLPALGLLIPLAVVGAWRLPRPLTSGPLLVLVWIGLAAILMYTPTGVQRRFGLGLHPMLALLAAPALMAFWQFLGHLRPPARLLRPFALVGLGQALFGSTVYLYVVAFSIALAPGEYLAGPGADRAPYQQASVRAVGDWLARTGRPADLVLASTVTGNYLGGVYPGRVYVGHWVATLDYETKKKQAEWFFAAPVDDARRELLARAGVTYVVVGPHERLLGASEPTDPLLTPVFHTDGATVYRVQR
ncbi:MAG: hypothetical protein U0893_21375 [Chloroflexota bacterium]